MAPVPPGPTRVCHALPAPDDGPAQRPEHHASARTRGSRPARLEALLADLGSQVRQGVASCEPLALCPTGLPEIDRLLGGGFPRGRLSELNGGASSGRTSLALALLAQTTHAGQLAALVDEADAFDPVSAEAAGVDLDRVLWARAHGWREALRSTERLLQTDGIPLVLLDLGPCAPPAAGAAAWLRLARMAAGTRSALLLLAPQRLAGFHAEIALEMQRTGVRFSGAPPLLEELETRAVLVRHRSAPAARAAPLRLPAA